jgi:hypothetical protein
MMLCSLSTQWVVVFELVNANEPSWMTSSPVLYVEENLPIGTVFFNVTTFDYEPDDIRTWRCALTTTAVSSPCTSLWR